MIDTVSFLTPAIPQFYIDKINRKLRLYCCIESETLDILYQFSTGQIYGSYDSSINIKVNKDNTLKITCSLHKIILGYNIAYGGDNLVLLANCLKKIIYKYFDVKLPDVLTWELQRIDWTLTFNLHSQDNVNNYISSLQSVKYGRRQTQFKSNQGVWIPGATNNIKFYNKQNEFLEHDYKKIKKICGQEKADQLLNLCNGLIRVEVSIFSRKIKNLFPKTIYRKNMKKRYDELKKQYGLQSDITSTFEKNLYRNKVTLKDFNIKTIIDHWESEVSKMIKDKNTVLVNKDDLVLKKLNENFNMRKVNGLYSFWTLLSTRGEEYVKSIYKKQTYYNYRKDLIECGISWKDTNIYIETDHKVISFVPSLNSEFLYDLNKPNMEYKENVYQLLRGA